MASKKNMKYVTVMKIFSEFATNTVKVNGKYRMPSSNINNKKQYEEKKKTK